jgi:RHS repeat-associated protein
VKKLVRRGPQRIDITVFIDGLFDHQKQVRGSERTENNTIHVMDNLSRVATIRIGPALPDDGAPAARVKYHLADHLGSSILVLGGTTGTGSIFINCEEYYPYGETSFGSFGRKRYRFTGKERDEESGLYYYGSRYYAPWLNRWVSCDPAGMVDTANLYAAMRDRPIGLIDPTGRQSTPPTITSSPAATGSQSESGEVRAARQKFRSDNIESSISGNLSKAQLDKIDHALRTVLSNAEPLMVAFYLHYTGENEILTDTADSVAKLAESSTTAFGIKAKFGQDTTLNQDLFTDKFSHAFLGGVLIHEFVHMRHDNPQGSPYLEGESYGVEKFLAERFGEKGRVEAIGKLKTYAAQQAAFDIELATAYLITKMLFARVENVTPPKYSPEILGSISPDRANQLLKEFVVPGVKSPGGGCSCQRTGSQELIALNAWARQHAKTLQSSLAADATLQVKQHWYAWQWWK